MGLGVTQGPSFPGRRDSNLSVSSDPCPYVSFEMKPRLPWKGAHTQVPAPLPAPLPRALPDGNASPLGSAGWLVPAAIRWGFLLPFKGSAGPEGRGGQAFQLAHMEPLACHWRGAFASVAGRRAKNSRANAPGRPWPPVFIGCKNIGAVCWVPLGLCPSQAWQGFLLQPHPRLIFGLQTGTPPAGHGSGHSPLSSPQVRVSCFLRLLGLGPLPPHYTCQRGWMGPHLRDHRRAQSLCGFGAGVGGLV